MNVRHLASRIGALVCFLTVIAAAAPFLLIDGYADLIGAYYGAGPIGLTAIVLFTAVGGVAFASAERGNVDPVTMAGGLVALGAVVLVGAVLWWFALDDTVLYSFPREYRWIEWHPTAVVVAAIGVAASAGVYARSVLE
ncbi:hypothetical protein [Halopenitus sp. POP-27]|uniref:DUF7548 family protein n=1 Tax=Halopenitus sp. POP-27 TaxID=2994425 RepID=UPI0024682EDC|nr:hypothetical protein [Halopenitus sp. POP-27]